MVVIYFKTLTNKSSLTKSEFYSFTHMKYLQEIYIHILFNPLATKKITFMNLQDKGQYQEVQYLYHHLTLFFYSKSNITLSFLECN